MSTRSNGITCSWRRSSSRYSRSAIKWSMIMKSIPLLEPRRKSSRKSSRNARARLQVSANEPPRQQWSSGKICNLAEWIYYVRKSSAKVAHCIWLTNWRVRCCCWRGSWRRSGKVRRRCLRGWRWISTICSRGVMGSWRNSLWLGRGNMRLLLSLLGSVLKILDLYIDFIFTLK